ncbi:MAG: helix-turn-helix domain-containing protein, partial [Anaerolineaceae bacterium]
NQDIPLHTFRTGLETTHEEISLEYLSFSDAPALTQSTNPHRHNFYEVLYVTGGMGTHYIDSNAYPIEPNTFYFISPGQVHYWNVTIPIEGEILVFMDDFLLLAPADYMVLHELSFFHTVEGSPTLQLDEFDHLQVMSLLRAIAEEFKTYEFRSASVLRAYLHILLVQIQRLCAIQEAKAGNRQEKIAQKLTRQFKKLVTNQYVTGQSVQDYADQLGVTVNHLNKTLKATTGCTPGQLIRREIVLEAKRLFQHTDLTATEIGYRLAFNDPSYFGRFFKREVGVSPGQFRRDLSGSTL